MACEAFDPIGNAMDEAWRRVKFNHLSGRQCRTLRACFTHFRYGQTRRAKSSASH